MKLIKNLQNVNNTERYNILYLYYIRYKIFKFNSIDDIVKIFNSINFYLGNMCNTDNILNFLLQSLALYSLTEKEMQKISLYQQSYHNK